MKRVFKYLTIIALAAFAISCENGDNNELPNNPVEKECYRGTMKVDQNDGTFYTQEDVKIDYEIIDGKVGKRDFGFTSFTGGLVVRLCRPLYLYAGGGYVKKDIYYQFIGNPKNIHEPKGSFKSYAIDGGLMFKFKGFNLSGGCIHTPQGGFYGNVGIGFWI